MGGCANLQINHQAESIYQHGSKLWCRVSILQNETRLSCLWKAVVSQTLVYTLQVIVLHAMTGR